jgi:hypothetical protein
MVLPQTSGCQIELYTDGTTFFLHPDDESVCAIFNDLGLECPCETWKYVGKAGLPWNYYLEKQKELGPTGYMLTYHGRYYEVLDYQGPEFVNLEKVPKKRKPNVSG